MATDHIFEIITFSTVVKKGVVILKPKSEKITTPESLSKKVDKLKNSTILRFHIINKKNNTKTLYNRVLGAKNFSKKVCKL